MINNELNYQCRVITIRKTKTRADGSTVERVITKHSVPVYPPPQIGLRHMYQNPSTSRADVFVPTKSPLSQRRNNGKRKWFRPKIGKRVLTELAIKMVKEFGGLTNAGIMNPVSKKVLKGFTRMQIVFPPNNIN